MRTAWCKKGLALALILAVVAPALAQAPRDEYRRENRGLRFYDILEEIREHFRLRLAYGWYIEDPTRFMGGYEVRLHIPIWWRGNPVSAAADLCPDPRSDVWQGTSGLVIRPYHLELSWPPIHCRSRGG